MMIWKPLVAAGFLLVSQPADDAQLKNVFSKCNDHGHARDLNAGRKQRAVYPDGTTKDIPLPPRVIQEYEAGWEDCETVINEYNQRQDKARLQSILDNLDKK